ncbi:hypothetical protein ACFTWF_03230 [Rhodococcus sp. NPDC056960]|uniref:hypothetical protein n=1 Tax=Rhodococcus sp. NPDC056960 TaxID=3345982 RepID=UPI003628C45F
MPRREPAAYVAARENAQRIRRVRRTLFDLGFRLVRTNHHEDVVGKYTTSQRYRITTHDGTAVAIEEMDAAQLEQWTECRSNA